MFINFLSSFFMSKNSKMDSKELGLVLGQQLLGVDDLHYGLWMEDLELSYANLPIAQQRYTEMLIAALPVSQGNTRVIDIGCGTGHVLVQLVARGFLADGLVPAPNFAEQVRKRFDQCSASLAGKTPKLFECTFEAFPVGDYIKAYDGALFSESFQYIPMPDSFSILSKILKPGGKVVMCDFCKTEHHGDGQPGDKSFGGGHKLAQFYHELEKHPFTILRDEDITRQTSPNIRLVDETLRFKLMPAGQSIDRFLVENYPRSWKVLKWVTNLFFGKKLQKQKYKYFSGYRTQEVFERYKSYRLIVLERDTEG
jgi:SAM-dependent methyltransferase